MNSSEPEQGIPYTRAEMADGNPRPVSPADGCLVAVCNIVQAEAIRRAIRSNRPPQWNVATSFFPIVGDGLGRVMVSGLTDPEQVAWCCGVATGVIAGMKEHER